MLQSGGRTSGCCNNCTETKDKFLACHHICQQAV